VLNVDRQVHARAHTYLYAVSGVATKMRTLDMNGVLFLAWPVASLVMLNVDRQVHACSYTCLYAVSDEPIAGIY
jgi:hypothetical protein